MSEKNDNKDKNEEEVEEEEVEDLPAPPPSNVEERKLWIRDLPLTEGCFPSPIDLNLAYCVPLELPSLVWVNFENLPKKTKINNTGHTLIYSAKWNEERPYICDGPLIGKYVLSTIHFHWGATALEGSEHTIDGGPFPAEMHVVFFKSSYLTLEAALKEQDGCVTLAYLLKLQDTVNPGLQVVIDGVKNICTAGSSKRIENISILRLIREFNDDYLMYWGSVTTEDCAHYVLWLVTRKPVGINQRQLEVLRYLNDEKGQALDRNYRDVHPLEKRRVFHVNPSSSQYATLLPLTHDIYLQYYLTQIFYYKDIKTVNMVMENFFEDCKSFTQHSGTDSDAKSEVGS